MPVATIPASLQRARFLLCPSKPLFSLLFSSKNNSTISNEMIHVNGDNCTDLITVVTVRINRVQLREVLSPEPGIGQVLSEWIYSKIPLGFSSAFLILQDQNPNSSARSTRTLGSTSNLHFHTQPLTLPRMLRGSLFPLPRMPFLPWLDLVNFKFQLKCHQPRKCLCFLPHDGRAPGCTSKGCHHTAW